MTYDIMIIIKIFDRRRRSYGENFVSIRPTVADILGKIFFRQVNKKGNREKTEYSLSLVPGDDVVHRIAMEAKWITATQDT